MPIPEFILALREKVGHEPLWLSGVTAVVVRGEGEDREVLLVRRADNGATDEEHLVRRADNGAWTSVSGVIDPGEEPAVAGAREVLEEASVVAVPERFVWLHIVGPVQYPNGDVSSYIDHVFLFRYVSGIAAVGDDENTDVGWFRLDALPELPPDHIERIHHAVHGGAEARFEF